MKLSFLHGISALFRKGIVLEDGAQVRDLFFAGKNNYGTKPKKLRRFFFDNVISYVIRSYLTVFLRIL